MQVLIVEDDAELAAAIADYLSLFEVECDFAYSGGAGLEMARHGNFDIIILDLMLPRMNGLSVCKALREQEYNIPILMLTACDTDADQLEGFLAGVDDYVTKPCSMPILWARLQAIYRRNNPSSDELVIGTLKLNLRNEKAYRDNLQLKLSPISWKILELLARHTPEVVSRKTIEQNVWPDGQVDSGNFNVQLHMLRKIVDHPFDKALIHTVIGKGLCLREQSK